MNFSRRRESVKEKQRKKEDKNARSTEDKKKRREKSCGSFRNIKEVVAKKVRTNKTDLY